LWRDGVFILALQFAVILDLFAGTLDLLDADGGSGALEKVTLVREGREVFALARERERGDEQERGEGKQGRRTRECP